MPANQGLGNPNWHPQPDFEQPYSLSPQQEMASFVPSDLADCSHFIIEQCNVPDVAIYSGLPEQQLTVAEHIAALVYEPGKDVLPSLQRYYEQRLAEEAAIAAARRAEIYPPQSQPVATVYVVSTSRHNEQPESHTAGRRKSRVSA